MKRLHSQRAFTLIEVMITVAIIGILAAIAVPNYSNYVRRSALQEGFAAMADMRVKMEQFYQTNRNYGDSSQLTPCGHDGTANRVSFASTSRFTYICQLGGSDQSYTITATGIANATGNEYTVNHANAKSTTKFKGATVSKSCWVVNGDEC